MCKICVHFSIYPAENYVNTAYADLTLDWSIVFWHVSFPPLSGHECINLLAKTLKNWFGTDWRHSLSSRILHNKSIVISWLLINMWAGQFLSMHPCLRQSIGESSFTDHYKRFLNAKIRQKKYRGQIKHWII